MKYIFTILGFVLGLMTMNLWGIVLGALLGHSLDRLVGRHRANGGGRADQRIMKIPQDARPAFFLCTFSMLAKISKADGLVSDDERRRIEDYIDNELNLDQKHKKLALDVFNEALESPLTFRDYAEKFKETYPDRVKIVDTMIDILVQVSVSDGVLSPEEDELLRSGALLLGLTLNHYQRLKKQYVRSEMAGDEGSSSKFLH